MKTGCGHAFQKNLEFRISRVPVRIAQDHCIGSNLRPIETVRSQGSKATRTRGESQAGNVDMIHTNVEILDRIEARGCRICRSCKHEFIAARTTPDLIRAAPPDNGIAPGSSIDDIVTVATLNSI